MGEKSVQVEEKRKSLQEECVVAHFQMSLLMEYLLSLAPLSASSSLFSSVFDCIMQQWPHSGR